MPTAYVLYVADDIVGPCLHLIRCVCNPESRSRPHVTVRYPIERLQGNLTAYQSVTIDTIDIVEPGAFDLEYAHAPETHTVFLRCDSDLLQTLSYKPDFPESVFHITLYDGKSLVFAKQLLQVLQRFPWGFRVVLPSQTKLTRIQVGRSKQTDAGSKRESLDNLQTLFRTIASKPLSTTLLTSLTDVQRLELTEAICARLHDLAVDLPRIAHGSGTADETTRKALVEMDRQESDYYSLGSSKRLSEDHDLLAQNRLIHLTPPELAQDIVEYTVSRLDTETAVVDFGDPAVGTGVFFSALLSTLPIARINSAIGIDIDPKIANETRKRWSHRGLVVKLGDYLHMDKLPARTLIVANPPYLRYQQIPAAYRLKLQERASVQVGMQISGQSGLYVYFLLLSHGWMQRDALAAWLVPSEFMETNYGAVVRRYLTERVELLRIHRFRPDRVQFERGLVTSAVAVFRNRTPAQTNRVLLSSGDNLRDPEHTEQVAVSELIGDDKWRIPWIRHHTSSKSAPRIGDLFTVHRGLATGANDFFVMDRRVAAQRRIPDTVLRPVLPKARALKTDVIEREDDGYPRVFPQLCLLDCDLPEDEIRRMHPALATYLRTAPERVTRSTLVRSRRPWYRQEQREPSPFLCTYMGRGSRTRVPLYFIWNRSDAVALNTYLMLYPREELRRLMTKSISASENVFNLLKTISCQDLQASGRIYGGGLHKIEPKELLNLRFVSCPTWLEQMVQEHLHLT